MSDPATPGSSQPQQNSSSSAPTPRPEAQATTHHTNAVTDYYLNKLGFDCDDVRIKRLLALATQKFIADVATDAFQHCKVRQSGNRKTGKERKTVLTMEDLSPALAEYGVNVKKPEYYS
ncbi:unnamed protein product [Rhizopus stolonifer]